MTLDHFRKLAETWGGDIGRWPLPARDAAYRIAASAEGSAILEEQRAMDRLFASVPEVSDARAGRISFAALQRLSEVSVKAPWYRRVLQPASLFPAAGLACSILVGAWLAVLLPYHQQDEGIAVISMMFDSSAIAFGGVQ